MSLVDGKPRSADAVAADTTELWILDREDFRQAIRQSPEIALGVMAGLADRVREVDQRFAGIARRDVLSGVASVLLEALETGAEEDEQGGRRILMRLSHQAIADQASTTRESVSRALAHLRNVHLLRMEGRRIVVLDERKLRHYAQR